jgi:ribosomal protein L11 methyltransferase
MIYTKFAVSLIPYSTDASDVLIAMFGDAGFESFVETETGFEAYIPSQNLDVALIDAIELPFEGVSFTYNIEEIADQNWNEVWEKNYFQPIVIGNECVVRGPFHPEFPEIPHQIVIEPKMAFGTGHHETTGMMLQYILENNMAGANILDMGCGTGILGILASMRGATHVLGIDIDKWCTDNTIENCELNHISNMEVQLGDVSLLIGDENYDIILANINRNILLSDIQKYVGSLKNNGYLFVSGFYQSDLEVIVAEAQRNGLKLLDVKEQNQWVAARFVNC